MQLHCKLSTFQAMVFLYTNNLYRRPQLAQFIHYFNVLTKNTFKFYEEDPLAEVKTAQLMHI